MGLQVPLGVDYEIVVPSLGRGCRIAGQRGLAGYHTESGNDELRQGDQSGPRAYARVDTAECVDVPSRTGSERKQLAQAAERIWCVKEEVLGSTLVGPRLLGYFDR